VAHATSLGRFDGSGLDPSPAQAGGRVTPDRGFPPQDRVRWRQVGDHAERVALTLPLPLVVGTEYKFCAQIDHNNPCRQDHLRLEKRLCTHHWSLCANVSLSRMCFLDAWLLCAGARGASAALTRTSSSKTLQCR